MSAHRQAPPLRAHVAGLTVGALSAPLLILAGAFVLDGEGLRAPGAALVEVLPLALIVFLTGAVSALPVSVLIERVWPRPAARWSIALVYAALGAAYALAVQAWLLQAVSWRYVLVGAVGATLARAGGGWFARFGTARSPVWAEHVDDG